MRTVALDYSSRKIAYCEVADGKVVCRGTARDVAGLRAVLGDPSAPARVAIEACREAWCVHDELSTWGHEVVLVDTTRVKRLGVGGHGRKTDRIDAEILAFALANGMIPEAHVLSPERRRLRNELTVRATLVRTRSVCVTQIRGILRSAGSRLGSCDTEQFVQRVEEAALEDDLRATVTPLLVIVTQLNTQITSVEARITEQVEPEKEPAVALMCTVPGVGLIVAAMMVSVIDTPGRFESAHQVQSYLGLVPSEYASGQTRRLGSITKKGNSYLRGLLVQAAWSVLRRPGKDPLKLWGTALAERRGKRIAVVGVARRLAGLLWAMWRDGTFYDPEELGKRTAEGMSRRAQSLERTAAAIKAATKKIHRKYGQRLAVPSATEVCSTS